LVTRRWAVALTLLWAVAMAGCGQSPPSSGGGAEETTAETTAETTTVEVGGSPELDAAADEYEEYASTAGVTAGSPTRSWTRRTAARSARR
jgi:hypothetical protein